MTQVCHVSEKNSQCSIRDDERAYRLSVIAGVSMYDIILIDKSTVTVIDCQLNIKFWPFKCTSVVFLKIPL